MLQITQEQFRALEDGAAVQFQCSLSTFIRTHFSNFVPGLSHEQLQQRTDFGVSLARSLGLSQKDTIEKFVVTQFVCAPDFYQHPAIHNHLFQQGNDANEQMRSMINQIHFSTWAQIKQDSASDFWERNLA